MAALQAREDSIGSYTLVVERVRIESAAFSDEILDAAVADERRAEPRQLFESIVGRLGGGRPIASMISRTSQKGMRFKTHMTFPRGEEMVLAHDGERFLRFQPKAANKQVDIFPPSHVEGRYSLDQLGLMMAPLLQPGKVLSHEQQGDLLRMRFKASETFTTVVDFDSELAIRRRVGISNGNVVSQERYLCPRRFGTYVMPVVIVTDRQSGASHVVEVILLKDLVLNPAISEEELSIGEFPDKAVAVDYRQNPPKVETYRRLPAEWRNVTTAPDPDAGVPLEEVRAAEPERIGDDLASPGRSGLNVGYWVMLAIAVAGVGMVLVVVYRASKAKMRARGS